MATSRAGFDMTASCMWNTGSNAGRSLGDGLVQRGRIEVRSPGMGERIVLRFGLIDDDGETVLESELTGLLPEPRRWGRNRPAGAVSGPDPGLADSQEALARPRGYLPREVGNKILRCRLRQGPGLSRRSRRGFVDAYLDAGRAVTEYRPDGSCSPPGFSARYSGMMRSRFGAGRTTCRTVPPVSQQRRQGRRGPAARARLTPRFRWARCGLSSHANHPAGCRARRGVAPSSRMLPSVSP